MLRITNLTLSRGARKLLAGADLTVFPGQKFGLIGANGCGKSSLFALLRGDLLADAGQVELPARWKIGFVAQETPPSVLANGRNALDYALDGDTELRQIEAELAAAEADPHAADHGHRVGELHQRLADVGGYAAPARAAELLAGLGFRQDQLSWPVADFSGGWRMRLNLAQALLSRSDLLLLDEPTNHLDLDAVLWLEDWLSRFPGAVLLISHDRDFLDATVGRITHFDQNTLKTYTGNYSAFERARAEALALQQAAFAKQQRQVAHLQSYIDRFRAKATKAKQAQSRIKALERMELIAAAHVDSPFEFSFATPEKSPKLLVSLERADIGYPADDGSPRTILRGADCNLYAGERIGVLGPNGAGKSTLIKALCGRLPLLAGKRHEGEGLNIGYFAQHQLDELRPEYSPMWHVQRLDPTAREQDLRNFLGGFDFRGEMADAPCGPFSGGEKARLALALIVRTRPNLLLLDEPTNHLDLEMREALTEALQDYEGALVVIAHDRHLLRATCDTLWLVADGKLGPFDGDLDDYKTWAAAHRPTVNVAKPATPAGAAGEEAPVDRKAQKRAEAEARQRRSVARKPLEQRLKTIDTQLAVASGEARALDQWIASEAAYAAENRAELAAKTKRRGELDAQIATLEEEWLNVSSELEALDVE